MKPRLALQAFMGLLCLALALAWPVMPAEGGTLEASPQALREDQQPKSDLSGWLGNSVSITPSFYERDLRSFKPQGNGLHRDAVNFSMKSTLNPMVNGEAQVSLSSYDSRSDPVYDDRRNHLIRLKLAGDLGLVSYGAEYRSIGQGIRVLSGANWRLDQEGSEVWVGRTLGSFQVKGLFSDFTDNLENDPRRPRTAKTLAGSSVGYTLPGGALLSLSYQQGSSTTRSPNNRLPQEHSVEELGASLYYYAGPQWELSFSSKETSSIDKFDPSIRGTLYYHQVSGSYRPTDSITLTPSLSLMDERYSWGVRTTTPTATLSLSYAPSDGRLSLSMYGFYNRSRSSDGSYDVKTVSLVNSLAWTLGKEKNRSLSFDVISSQYLDAVYQSSSSKELLGRVMWKAIAF